ncbi:MAG: hypothetical protein ACT4ON_00155 [Bacteroidota bacterium]
MKKLVVTFLLFIGCYVGKAQEMTDSEQYGRTLNLGIGIGYYGYVGHALPVASFNYEFDVARNFTLAPFIGFYSYTNYYYWGDYDRPYRDYSYRETVVPVGVKGSYYFDQLFRAGEKWDFYASADLGFAFRTVTWDAEYNGSKKLSRGASPLYIDGHVGAEYHMNDKIGLFLDLSTGISTFGLAIHFQ